MYKKLETFAKEQKMASEDLTESESKLIEAVANGDIAATRDAIESGVDLKGEYGGILLDTAACLGCTDIAELLIKNGVDVSGKVGEKALRHAADIKADAHIGIVKLLVKNGANISGNAGTDALKAALFFNDKDFAKQLIDMGANLDYNGDSL